MQPNIITNQPWPMILEEHKTLVKNRQQTRSTTDTSKKPATTSDSHELFNENNYITSK